MRKYHHYGIPTKEEREDETLVEVGGFRFYSTPFEANKWQLQSSYEWMNAQRFSEATSRHSG